MLSQAEQVIDCVDSWASSFNGWGWTAFALLPLLLVLGSSGSVAATTATSSSTPVLNAAQSAITVYRVHQIDLPHGAFGSRSSTFSLEPVTPGHIGETFLRKVALFRLADLLQGHNQNSNGVDVYETFLSKALSQSLVSAVLIIFEDLQGLTRSPLSEEQTSVLQTIERKLLSNETALPIYFVEEGEAINRLYEEYSSKQQGSAKDTQSSSSPNIKTQPSLYDAVLKNVFSDSHQLVVSGPATSPVANAVVTSLQVRFFSSKNI